METIEQYDGTTWVLLTWPILILMLVAAVALGVIIGGLIGLARR